MWKNYWGSLGLSGLYTKKGNAKDTSQSRPHPPPLKHERWKQIVFSSGQAWYEGNVRTATLIEFKINISNWHGLLITESDQEIMKSV